MPVAALLAPLLKGLIANGLGTLAGAVAAKGKEFIEDKIGVKIPDSPSGLTPEMLQQLKVKEIEHEEFLIEAGLREKAMELEADAKASAQVSDRWKFDMTSDSWLSKNVRPIVLLYWTLTISVMAFAGRWLQVPDRWIALLELSYVTILGAYFVGRSVQHVMKMKNGKP